MIDWTKLEDGIEAWIVNDRPILVRDTQERGEPFDDDGQPMRIELMKEMVEGLLDWRVEFEQMNRNTVAVVKLCRVYPVTYQEFKEIPTNVARVDRENISSLCELAGMYSYSGEYRLSVEWRGHPQRSLAIWVSGLSRGCVAVFERPGLMGLVGHLMRLAEVPNADR